MPTLAEYLSLVPSQHAGRPDFIATLTAVLQPYVDCQALLAAFPVAFDLDTAAGVQLDTVGLWVGVSRRLLVPITGLFFSFDDPLLGFDKGIWRGPYDNLNGLTSLDDTTYRLLLRAKIATNHWDGTLAAAAAALAYIYNDQNSHVFIQDNQDNTFSLNVSGIPLTGINLAILSGGYIPLKPAGVRLAGLTQTSVGGTPLFGFDINNVQVGGFDTGAWGV